MINASHKKYIAFLDETGDHGLSFIDDRFPIFLLAGCIFEESVFNSLKTTIDTFKNQFFNTSDVILHSRDIRKCDGAFQILFDLNIKKQFYESLNTIMATTPYAIIAVSIDKKRHIERYGKVADNPYSICLSYMLERLIFYTDSHQYQSNLSIVIEKRGKKEDELLLSHYNEIIDRGTVHVTPVRFKQRIEDFSMIAKRNNNIGLQIADLCAYPIARHVLHSTEPYIPFSIIQNKLYADTHGKVEGYGLKVFP